MRSALPVAAIAGVSLLAGLSPAAARYAPRPRDQALARHLAEAWLQPRPAGYADLPARDAESACRLRGYRGLKVTGRATRAIGNRRTGVSVGVAATVFAAPHAARLAGSRLPAILSSSCYRSAFRRASARDGCRASSLGPAQAAKAGAVPTVELPFTWTCRGARPRAYASLSVAVACGRALLETNYLVPRYDRLALFEQVVARTLPHRCG